MTFKPPAVTAVIGFDDLLSACGLSKSFFFCCFRIVSAKSATSHIFWSPLKGCHRSWFHSFIHLCIDLFREIKQLVLQKHISVWLWTKLFLEVWQCKSVILAYCFLLIIDNVWGGPVKFLIWIAGCHKTNLSNRPFFIKLAVGHCAHWLIWCMILHGNVTVIIMMKLFYISLISIATLHTITLKSGTFCILLRCLSQERSYPSSICSLSFQAFSLCSAFIFTSSRNP